MIGRTAEGDRGRKYTERYRWNQLTDEHDSTGEAKLNTPNMEHGTVKIKQEIGRVRHSD